MPIRELAITNPSRKREGCKHSHDDNLQHYFENFTQSALTDELVQRLSSKFDCDIFEDNDGHSYLHVFRPYLSQAEGLLYRINISEYPTPFVIWKEDIPDDLIETLLALGIVVTKRIMTEVVRRLYESVDSNYFHTNGLYNKTPWKFGKSTKK